MVLVYIRNLQFSMQFLAFLYPAFSMDVWTENSLLHEFGKFCFSDDYCWVARVVWSVWEAVMKSEGNCVFVGRYVFLFSLLGMGHKENQTLFREHLHLPAMSCPFMLYPREAVWTWIVTHLEPTTREKLMTRMKCYILL